MTFDSIVARGRFACPALVCCLSACAAWLFLDGRATAATFLVTNSNDSGAGSLRQAILSANAAAGQDAIQFAISLPSGAVATIAPVTPLPDITGQVTIDGYSEPGSTMNSLARGFDAVLRIRLSGAVSGPGVSGLVIKANGCIIRGLIIDGFGASAIRVVAPATPAVITGNVIGKGYGTLPLDGNGSGVFVDGAVAVRIGGLLAGERNVIAGNQQEGVLLGGAARTDATVRGNRIGLDAFGAAEGNRIGVRILAGGASVGGTLPDAGNTIAANVEADVQVEGGAFGGSGFSIAANRIGTDDAGLVSRGSKIGVLAVGATAGAIGSSSGSAGNIVFGTDRAIEIRQSTGLTVSNNFVCRSASGQSMGTCGAGIRIQDGGSHVIGGTVTGSGNVVANCVVGIDLWQTSANTVDANTIEDNSRAGVLLTGSSANTIGGTIGNTVRRSGAGTSPNRGGIVVISGTANTILRNAVSANALAGIDLGGDGITPNDAGDTDQGANNLQNFPVIASAVAGATTAVAGTLSSAPSRGYRLQFFASPGRNPTGNAEGETYLGETGVTTDATGIAAFAVVLPAVAPGAIVSATATMLEGTVPRDTSEFSSGIVAIAAPPSPPTITAVTPPSGPTAGGTLLTITGTNFVAGQTTVTVGGAAATNVSVASAGLLNATTPAHAAGTVSIVATTPAGSATRANAFTYTTPTATDTPLVIALNRLRAASLDPLVVEFEKGLPIHVKALVPAGTPGEPPWRRALAVLDQYRDLYQIVSDGSVRFRPDRQRVNADGTAHVWLQQLREGIPIAGSGILMHFRGNYFTGSIGRWISSLSRWYAGAVETQPFIPLQVAFEHAMADAGGSTSDPNALIGNGGLVFYAPALDHDATWTRPTSTPAGIIEPEDLPRLAWRLAIHAPGGPWDYIVDGRDGRILEATTREHDSLDLEIFTARGHTSSICFGGLYDPTILWFTEDGQQVGAGDLDDDGDGVDAYNFIQEVYDYWRDAHDRESYDGSDSQIEMYLNYGHVANSFGSEYCLKFGDDFVTRDLVSHEFTHAVTQTTSDLAYRRESGAINEHMSDVFGVLVDSDDWFIGEDLPEPDSGIPSCAAPTPRGAARNLADPPNCGDPDHMLFGISGDITGFRVLPAGQTPNRANDWGSVHTNSGILNKVAYLVTEGGTHNGTAVTGIGRSAMGDIWYFALASLLTRRSQFTDLRWATRTVAEWRYGRASNQQCQILNAFASVGIGAPDSDCDGQDDSEESDDDDDFITDAQDNCPINANPDQGDADGDGAGDACDSDADNDAIANALDLCPLNADSSNSDRDHDDIGDVCDDSDGDFVMDSDDNCPTNANHFQEDTDSDGFGDACDGDDDSDGWTDRFDNCPLVANNGQEDADGDGVGDACDNCRLAANANQANNDGDASGDECDADDDNDSVGDASDLCPLVFDPQQVDMDRNGIGLRCDSGEAAMLSGEYGWRNINVPFMNESPVEIPFFPCVDDGCPGSGEAFAPGQRYVLRLGNTAQVDARIVDAAGHLVARGRRGAAGQTLEFELAPTFRAESRAALPQGVTAEAISTLHPYATGPDEPAYFLQLAPLSASVIGQTLQLAASGGLNAGTDGDDDGVADRVDSCVDVANTDQDDADGDGLGDACDNCPAVANGPAVAPGGLAAQADADADATGDACDVPRYLAEGATSTFFDVRIALLNPAATSQHVVLRYQRGDGTTFDRELTLAPTCRATIDPKTVPELESAEFSTMIDSAGPVLADRTMTWDAGGYGSHTETATLAPALTWYLAEGATHSGFELFYLIQNADASRAADVEVTYLRPAPHAPVVRTYTVAPHSRFNIWVNRIDELSNAEISAVLRSANGVPIIVERAMYLGGHGRVFDAGHDSAGVTAPATSWFLAEGATGRFFDLFVLVANPGATAAGIRANYLLPSGQTLVKDYVVEPQSRFNIWVDLEDPALAETAVSTTIESLDDIPIVVERTMWWGDADGWYEAHNSPGATATGTSWGLAEGEVGGPQDAMTYILVANTSERVANVRVRLLFEDGSVAERLFQVLPRSRFNVDVGFEMPEADGRRFGAIVESLGPSPARIVVERAMYTSPGGTFWAAGTNALATRLR